MKAIRAMLLVGVIGLVGGVVLAEFYPNKIETGLFNQISNAVNEPFSEHRNKLAVQWGMFGAAAGAVLGLVVGLVVKK
jgi:hypothetical protein